MATTKEEEVESDFLDVRLVRADALRGFRKLAEAVFDKDTEKRSLLLTCSQFYCDEAADAVHETILDSAEWMPTEADASRHFDWQVRRQHMHWDDNGSAVYAFAPMCNEEGWTEESGSGDEDEYQEGGWPSPVAIAQKGADGRVTVNWLAGLHRPWLDFPGALADREDFFGDPPTFAEDPSPPALVGVERDLYAQVLAHPDDAGARDVLGDAWMTRNDPRGEFTALHRVRGTHEARSRMAELVLEHGRSWLGPLQKVVPLSGALFGHGPFVRKAVVYITDSTWDDVSKAPEWASLEELTFANQSMRIMSPAMKNLRAVGPLGPEDLARFAKDTWRVEDLDFEVGADESLAALVQLNLPLKRLRLRASGPLAIAQLESASWWPTIERIEVWLPGTTTPKVVGDAHGVLASSSPPRIAVAVGALHGTQRSGWMLTGRASERRLELARIDGRYHQLSEWSKALGVPHKSGWTDEDDWLCFGLGVA